MERKSFTNDLLHLVQHRWLEEEPAAIGIDLQHTLPPCREHVDALRRLLKPRKAILGAKGLGVGFALLRQHLVLPHRELGRDITRDQRAQILRIRLPEREDCIHGGRAILVKLGPRRKRQGQQGDSCILRGVTLVIVIVLALELVHVLVLALVLAPVLVRMLVLAGAGTSTGTGAGTGDGTGTSAAGTGTGTRARTGAGTGTGAGARTGAGTRPSRTTYPQHMYGSCLHPP